MFGFHYYITLNIMFSKKIQSQIIDLFVVSVDNVPFQTLKIPPCQTLKIPPCHIKKADKCDMVNVPYYL
jgi:hypothetical protein